MITGIYKFLNIHSFLPLNSIGLIIVYLYVMARAVTNGSWNVGLANSQNLYLSAESFQFKVNASGKTMKAKQIWTIEQQEEDKFAIKSCMGRYLGCDKNGVITAISEDIGRDNVFSILHQGSERFELKSSHGHSVGGSHDNLAGRLRESRPEGWTIHLATVPQINLYNIQRKGFARTNGSQFCAKAEIPWGHECIIFLQYCDGKYCFQDVNKQFLCRDGTLKSACDEDCRFVLFFTSGNVAFRDSQGKFLSCVGPQATLQSSKKDGIGQTELFKIHNAKPQFSFLAYNQKYLSNKQGTDVRANQVEVESTEIFQLETVNTANGCVKWAVLGPNKCYWSVEANSLACTGDSSASSSGANLFELVWKSNGKVLVKCSNGKFLQAKSGGQLSPSGTSEEEEPCQFQLQLMNRAIIVFQGCYGFIGSKGASGILECNRSQPEFFKLVYFNGKYHIQTNNDKYWKVSDNDLISAAGHEPTEFMIELHSTHHSQLCIVAPNGKYICGSQNGALAANGTQVKAATVWTF